MTDAGPVALSARRRVYLLLHPAEGSTSVVNRLIIALILLSAATVILETEPTLHRGRELLFDGLERGFASLFLLEYATRLWIAPELPRLAGARHPRLAYMVSPLALIDLIAIVPSLLLLAGGGTLLLRFARVARLLRLARIGRFSRAWLHITRAVWLRRFELGLTLIIGLVALLASATLLYWIEGAGQPEQFGSIPRALWWSVVTLTTVGYGDVYPSSVLGKITAGAISVLAIGLIALPTGILASAFSDAVHRHKADDGDGSSEGRPG